MYSFKEFLNEMENPKTATETYWDKVGYGPDDAAQGEAEFLDAVIELYSGGISNEDIHALAEEVLQIIAQVQGDKKELPAPATEEVPEDL